MADKDPGSVKVSSLPFYRDAPRSEYTARPEEASVLRDGFRAAREGVTEVVEAGREARDAVNHVVDTGAAHSSSALYQLREEENLPARLAVISGAGLLGLLAGRLRGGGVARRVLWSGLGAGAGAAVCYPDETREAGAAVYAEGSKSALDAYNFVTGVSSAEEIVKSNLLAANISIAYRFLVKMWNGFSKGAD